MLNPKEFYSLLQEQDLDHFFGVPDSTLKYLCSYVDDHAKEHVICANEGSAIGQAIGFHLATGKTPVVYMQNSGFGNALNPILSMASSQIYSIPMIILVGWRGEPGVHDEPQHLHQGKVLLPSLGAMELANDMLPTKLEAAQRVITEAVRKAKQESRPYFLIIKKGTFEQYQAKPSSDFGTLKRQEVIQKITAKFIENKFIATTGFISRELFQLREKNNEPHDNDFLCIGSMGHTSQIAYSYAKYSKSKTICLDGDGSFLMHMGGTTAINELKETNIIHIVLNNACHLSVGGQPTVSRKVNLHEIAKACGFKSTYLVQTEKDLDKALTEAKSATDPIFIDIRVTKEALKDLMRPNLTPIQMKKHFMGQS